MLTYVDLLVCTLQEQRVPQYSSAEEMTQTGQKYIQAFAHVKKILIVIYLVRLLPYKVFRCHPKRVRNFLVFREPTLSTTCVVRVLLLQEYSLEM